MVFHVKLWHLLAAALLLAEMVTQTLRNLLYLHKNLTGDADQLRRRGRKLSGLPHHLRVTTAQQDDCSLTRLDTVRCQRGPAGEPQLRL